MDITAKSVTRYINSKYEAASEKLIPFRNVGERDRIPIILRETESFLGVLLDLARPVKIFEIGTAIGYSAAFFAVSREDAEVYSVEKDEYAFRAAQANIRNAGVEDRVHLYLGDGQEVAERLRDEGIRDFDMIFIDAAKSHYRRFLDSSLGIAKDGCLVVCDNILQHGMTCDETADPKNKHKTNITAMKNFIDHLYLDDELKTRIFSIGDGIAVSEYRKKNG